MEAILLLLAPVAYAGGMLIAGEPGRELTPVGRSITAGMMVLGTALIVLLGTGTALPVAMPGIILGAATSRIWLPRWERKMELELAGWTEQRDAPSVTGTDIHEKREALRLLRGVNEAEEEILLTLWNEGGRHDIVGLKRAVEAAKALA